MCAFGSIQKRRVFRSLAISKFSHFGKFNNLGKVLKVKHYTNKKLSMNINSPGYDQDALVFSLPAFFNTDTILDVIKLQEKQSVFSRIDEIYGCLSHSCLGHGRSSSAVSNIVSLDEVRFFRDFVEKNGIRFNYLINAPFFPSRVSGKEARQHIYDIINIVQPSAVTVSSLIIARLVRDIAPDMPIIVSTIAGVRAPEDLVPYLEFNPFAVTPHHDLGRSLNELAKLSAFTKSQGVNIRLLVNESCIFNCEKRKSHYGFLCSGEKDDFFQHWCNKLKYDDPSLLLQSGWIRPEDVPWIASHFGVTHFKISGRAKTPDWLATVITAYAQGSYSGNLMQLLATTPPWTSKPYEEVFVENKALDGFLREFPDGTILERQHYCKKWAELLMKEGNMSLKKNALSE